MVDAKLYIDVEFRNLNKQMDQMKSNMQKSVGSSKAMTGAMFNLNDITAANRGLMDVGKTYNRLADAGMLNNRVVAQLKRQFVELSKTAGNTITNLDKQFKSLTKSQKTFNFNFLTFLFAGMMLQRVFGGALRSIIDSYKKMTGMNSEFNKGVLKLNASWNFLKFSIANALNSPAVINGLQWLTDGLETMADFFAENEWAAQALLGTMAGLFALGSISLFIGSLMQMGMMLDLLWKGILGIKTAWMAVSAFFATSAGASILAALGWIALAVGFIALTWRKDFDDLLGYLSTGFSILIDLMKSSVGVMVALFSGDIDALKAHAMNIMVSLTQLSVLVGEFLVRTLFKVMNTIVDSFITGWRQILSGFIYLVNGMINVANKIPGINIGLIDEDFGQGFFDSILNYVDMPFNLLDNVLETGLANFRSYLGEFRNEDIGIFGNQNNELIRSVDLVSNMNNDLDSQIQKQSTINSLLRERNSIMSVNPANNNQSSVFSGNGSFNTTTQG